MNMGHETDQGLLDPTSHSFRQHTLLAVSMSFTAVLNAGRR
jgi:hypothetical protein